MQFSAPLKASDLLRDLESSELTTSPIYISRRAIEGGTQYGFVLDYPLNRSRFVNMLNEVAPLHNFSVSGILDDWNLHEEAKKEKVSSSSYNTGYHRRLLYNHVRSLREHWIEFGKHRLLYYEILSKGTDIPETAPAPEMSHIERARKEFLMQRGLRRKPDMQRFYGSPEVNIGGRLANFLLTQTELGKRPYVQNWDTSRIINYFSQYSPEHRTRIIRRFFEQLSPAGQWGIVQSYYNVLLEQEMPYDTTGLVDLSTGWPKLKERISINRDDWEAEAVLLDEDGEDGKPIYRTLSETVKVRKHFLKPAISWTKQNQAGARTWNMDIDDDFYQAARGRFIEGQENVRVINSLAGLLMVAYYSPDIRASKDIWPERHGYNGPSRDGQEMKAAQVPVLALMRRDQLSESRFIREAEAYADTRS